MTNTPDTQPLPERIGPYKVLGRLGEGGMGIVYLAEQSQPVRRRVALKVIKRGMDSRSILQRFEVERQAIAKMEHPAIARVFDGGETEGGQPFFAMELVEGVPIVDYADRQRLSVEERLRLFLKVCAGVQHAHQKGVVHRDLTPNNVLVIDQDGRPSPKIIDFGLARAIDPGDAGAAGFTQIGEIFGTPAYMSPEQAGLDALDVDTRSDVYTLGILLYELLTGELPHGRPEKTPASVLEVHRRLRDEQPPRPSTRIVSRSGSGSGRNTDTAALRGAEPRALSRRLRGELDWIVMRALERDRERRYQTVNAFASDIERHLAHEPVVAGPPSAAYRLRKFIRRNRPQVLVAALLLASLVAGVIGTTWFMVEAQRQARRADAARRDADDRAAEELAARRAADAALAKFELLANVVLLRDAKAAAARLFPAWPRTLPALDTWLRDLGEPLAAVLPDLQRALAELSSRATGTEDGRPRFAERGDEFLHDTMSRLVDDLQGFVDPARGDLAAVRDRRRWAAEVGRLSIDAHAARWAEARDAIARADGVTASGRYGPGSIDLPPQIGLVPIGRNPATGLWEFHHLRSAAPDAALPTHDEQGRIGVTADTGVVFVLVPGGTVTVLGDPALGTGATEVAREIRVEPFFVARHEITQAQWRRLTRGATPSFYFAGRQLAALDVRIDDTHPVEQVSWQEADLLLAQHGLALPDEAQWEYACRAGTTTPWSCGADASALAGHANVADATAKRIVPTWSCDESITDGHVIPAPVGSFAANAFGLQDMHGNVWEWCRDAFGSPEARVMRGGSHTNPPDLARSSHRGSAPVDTRSNNLGVRAVRPIHRTP